MKIYDERVVKDYTEGDKQHCPQCGEQFAREGDGPRPPLRTR